MNQEFDFARLVELCERTHREMQLHAVQTVDRSLVVRNWLFGWYIVEFENGGAERSELYGRALIERLSSRLRDSGLKGCSPTNLRKFREFYRAYPEIQQTASVESIAPSEIQQTPSVDSFLTPTGITAAVPPRYRRTVFTWLVPLRGFTDYRQPRRAWLLRDRDGRKRLERARVGAADCRLPVRAACAQP